MTRARAAKGSLPHTTTASPSPFNIPLLSQSESYTLRYSRNAALRQLVEQADRAGANTARHGILIQLHAAALVQSSPTLLSAVLL